MSEEFEVETKVSRAAGNEPERHGGLLTAATLVVALAALGLAGWSEFRPVSTGVAAPSYTAAQRADARKKTCTAFATVRTGINLNTNLVAPGGPEDVTGALAAAANGRVSLYDGGQYLLARLDPATASDLADPIRKFASTLTDIGAGATAGLQNSDPEQAALLKEAGDLDVTITGLCK